MLPTPGPAHPALHTTFLGAPPSRPPGYDSLLRAFQPPAAASGPPSPGPPCHAAPPSRRLFPRRGPQAVPPGPAHHHRPLPGCPRSPPAPHPASLRTRVASQQALPFRPPALPPEASSPGSSPRGPPTPVAGPRPGRPCFRLRARPGSSPSFWPARRPLFHRDSL